MNHCQNMTPLKQFGVPLYLFQIQYSNTQHDIGINVLAWPLKISVKKLSYSRNLIQKIKEKSLKIQNKDIFEYKMRLIHTFLGSTTITTCTFFVKFPACIYFNSCQKTSFLAPGINLVDKFFRRLKPENWLP